MTCEEVEWINNGDSIILDGWYIHFKDMCAYGPQAQGEWMPNRVELIRKYIDSDYIAYYPFVDRLFWDDMGKRRISKPLFEDEKRDRLLQDAYEAYLIEKALKGEEA